VNNRRWLWLAALCLLAGCAKSDPLGEALPDSSAGRGAFSQVISPAAASAARLATPVKRSRTTAATPPAIELAPPGGASGVR